MATPGERRQDIPDGPTGAGERLVTLDFVRGVAVLGILFANIVAFAQPTTAYYWPPALVGGMDVADGWVWVAQFVLVDGKFRGLFTLLFGAGLVLFSERAQARGAGSALQLRRLAWLLAFGLAHYFLIWRGDILALYAVSGLVALSGLRLPEAKQLSIGLTMYLFGAAAMCVLHAGGLSGQGDGSASMLAGARAEAALRLHGTWLELVGDAFANRSGQLLQELLLVATTETIGLLFIGMALYRYGFFAGAIDPATLRRWGWRGLLAGGVPSLLAALWVHHGGFAFGATLFVFNGLAAVLHLPMILGLAALLVAWAPTAAASRLGARFAAAGRMAFSNYLGTSLVMVAIFEGWGLGLFGQFGRAELLAFVALGWLAMLACSAWWLARFRYGPLEWLWRCLTYGRVFALRRE